VAKKRSGSGPRRTREHIIASQSHNYVEKFFVDKGHTVDRPANDYGTDVLVNTFDEHGHAETGDIRIQLKASDNFKLSKDGAHISFKIDVRHYHYWMQQVMPVFLILFDAKKVKAYWLYVQAYFTKDKSRKPKKNAGAITVRVPVKNEFTERTVDYMRERKAAILEVEVGHEE
jgi:hypothetical protein